MEAVAFPNVFKRFPVLLKQGNIVLLEGKVEVRENARQFIIQQVFDLEEWLQTHSEKQPVLYIKVSLELQDETLLLRINQLLKKNKGNVQVVLHYEKTRKTIRLGNEYKVNPDPNVLNELRNILGSKNVVLKD